MKSISQRKIKCIGCGALVEDLAGKPHKYIGASQECWNLYGEVLAKEYGEYNYPQLTHRLTVDTYAIQHPGEPIRAEFLRDNKRVSFVSACDVYEFNDDNQIQKITSYCIQSK